MMKASYLQFPMKKRSLLALLAICAFAPAAFAGVEQTVNDLLPRLAAAKVEDRYSAQIELQQLAANAARPGAEAERAELTKVLAAKATDSVVPQPARVWIVRQLEYVGAAESVAALTTLLKGQDAELKECARRALEKNPAPAATESLRAALKQSGETNWKIGLIQALGERGDAQSVSLIAPSLGQPETSFAAASALGKIASEPAVKELWAAFDKNTVAAADALVTAANRLVAKGESERATAIYLRLRTVPANASLRAVGLTGLAKANPEGAKKLIAEGLSDPDWRPQSAAISAAQEIYGKDVSRVLSDLLPGLNPGPKVFVLRALDASAEKQVIAAAGDSEEMVRLAALERLGQIGSAASIPVLFQAATAGPSSTQKAAVAALARISDPGAGAAIAKLADQGEPKSRAVAITALAQRNDQTALPALLKYAGESNPEVSAAACAALAKLGTDNELEGLIQLVLAGKTPGANAALQAVATRAHDKAAAAQKIIALTQTAAPQQLAPLFDILVLLGGKEALAAISMFAGSSNAEVKDAAIRALANWPDFPATQPLLVIAADLHTKRVHNVLAVQAVARLVKSSDKEPAPARLKAALAAMNLAARDEEKKLVLSALASVPDRKAGEALRPFLGVPKYQKEAGLAAVTLAEALRKTDKPAAKDLAQAVKSAGISDEITRKANAILKKNRSPEP
jgi:HEAT repeat protein